MAVVAKPFVGLMPFAEADAAYFFGREKERRVLADNLLAAPLTLLYGESGAGKSSLLNAGVAYELRSEPEFVLTVFRNWRDDPLPALADAIRKASGGRNGGDAAARPLEVIRSFASTGRTLLVILDQFEEYFHYHSAAADVDSELARVLSFQDGPAHFLISVREDWLAALDRFKGRIPRLFDNYLRMQHLSRDGAVAAIEGPLRQFNTDHPNGSGVSWDDNLASRVIESILSNQTTLERGLQPDDRVQAPYLQMVMSSLWQREMDSGSNHIHSETLKNLGGARDIYEGHLSNTLSKELSEQERRAAPVLFRWLVTGSGRKQNLTVSELAESTGLPEALVRSVVEKLRDARILTQTSPGRGFHEAGYEFAHDVLAEAGLKYVRQEALETERRKAEEAKRLAAAEALAKEAAEARAVAEAQAASEAKRLAAVEAEAKENAERRARAEAEAAKRLRLLLVVLGATLILAVGAAAVALKQSRAAEKARQQALAAQGTAVNERGKAEKSASLRLNGELAQAAIAANLGHLPELAVILASYAVQGAHGIDPFLEAEAITTLRAALIAVSPSPLMTFENSASGLEWAPGSDRFAALDGKTLRISDGRAKKNLVTSASPAVSVAWSSDGKLLALSNSSSVNIWDANAKKMLKELAGARDAVAWHPKLPRLATSSARHSVIIWDLPGGEKASEWDAHDGDIDKMAWSPDGSRLATASEDGKLRVWRVADHRRLVNQDAFMSTTDIEPEVTWSPDGNQLVTSGLGPPLEFRNAATGQVLHSPGVDIMNFTAWSHDGRWLAAGTFTPVLKIVDASTGKLYLQVPSASATAQVAWHSGNRLLAVNTFTRFAGDKTPTTIQIYRLDALYSNSPDELLAMARSEVKRNLTAQECALYFHSQSCPPRP